MREKTFRVIALAAFCMAFSGLVCPGAANPAGPRAVILEPRDGEIIISLPLSVKVMVSHPDGVFRDTLESRIDNTVLKVSDWDTISPGSVTAEAIVYTVALSSELGESPDGVHVFEINDVFSSGQVSEGLANGPVRAVFTVDTTPPLVLRMLPASGTIVESLSPLVEIHFTEPIDPTSLPGSTGNPGFTFAIAGKALTGNTSWSADGTILIFRPDPAVCLGTATEATVSVTVKGLRDLAGLSMASPLNQTFKIKPIIPVILVSPEVSATWPDNGQTKVDINSPVSIRFTRPVNKSTLQSRVSMMSGSRNYSYPGLLVSNDVADPCLFIFSLASSVSPMQAETVYTVVVDSGVMSSIDSASMQTSHSFSFTTRTGDFPRVLFTSPSGGATGVDLLDPITVTFNTNLNSSTVSYLSMKVTTPAGPVRIKDLQVSGSVVSFKIFEAGSSEYKGADFTVDISGTVADFFGNIMDKPVSFTFTAAGDGVKPTVVSVSPAAGTQGVNRRPEMIIEFSEPMTRANVESAFTLSWSVPFSTRTLTCADGAVSWTSSDRIMKFVPSIDIPAGALVTVTLASTARDVAGNGLDDTGDGGAGGENYLFSFTVIDYSPVKLISASPAKGIAGVQPLSPVSFNFDKPVLLSTVVSGLKVTDSSGRPVRGTVSSVDGGLGVVFTPSELMLPGAVEIVIPSGSGGVADAAGNGFDGDGDGIAEASPADDYIHTITVRSAPRVVSSQPAHGEDQVSRDVKIPVEIVFDTPMNGMAFTPLTVTAFVGGDPGLVDILGLDTAKTKLKIEIFLGTRANFDEERITIRIMGTVGDIYGVEMGNDHQFTFMINNSERPRVLESGIEPADHAQHVITWPTITIPFSEAMDRVSVEAAFDLRPLSAGQYIGKSGIFSWSPDGTVMRFVPSVALIQGVSYEIEIKDTAADLAGVRLPDKVTTIFRTTDNVAPSLVTVIPVDGAIDVPIDMRLTLIFSKPMDLNTLYSIVISSDREIRIDHIDLDPDSDNRYTVTLKTPLLANKEYMVTIPRTVQDSRGNQLDMKYVTKFSTTGIGDFLEAGGMVLPGVRARAMILVQSNTSIGDNLTVKVQQRGAPAPVLVSMKAVKSPRSGSYVYKGIYQVLSDSAFFGAADISVSARIGGIVNVKTARFVVKE